ncbi:hypothetical protein WCLP8_4820007 [uncultured Gammaproteobacteria bacterium]
MTSHRPLIVDDGLIARLGDGDTLLLPSVTALRLLGTDGGRAVVSVNLAAFIKGSATVQVQDDSAGGVIMTVPQPLITRLQGDDGNAVAGSATDPAWDGAAPAATWTGLWKAAVARLEAIRSLLAGTLKVDPKQFCPASTVKLSVLAASVSASLPAGTTVLRIYNSGPSPVSVRWGSGPQTATVNDMPIASGAAETFGKSTSHDTFAAISTGMATVYVSAGSRI